MKEYTVISFTKQDIEYLELEMDTINLSEKQIEYIRHRMQEYYMQEFFNMLEIATLEALKLK